MAAGNTAIRTNQQADSPTRIEVAVQRSDLMFGCYASALRRKVVELPGERTNSLVDELKEFGG